VALITLFEVKPDLRKRQAKARSWARCWCIAPATRRCLAVADQQATEPPITVLAATLEACSGLSRYAADLRREVTRLEEIEEAADAGVNDGRAMERLRVVLGRKTSPI
jgi:hypothetical protein